VNHKLNVQLTYTTKHRRLNIEVILSSDFMVC